MADTNPNIEKLRTRMQLDPKGRAFAQFAEECRKTGLLDEALAACEKGLPNHPAYVAALVTYGRTLLAFGRTDEARAALEKAVEISPANLVANRALAELFFETKNYSLALDRYRMVRELNPLDAAAEEIIVKCEALLPEPDEPTGAFAAPVTLISAPAAPAEPTLSLSASDVLAAPEPEAASPAWSAPAENKETAVNVEVAAAPEKETAPLREAVAEEKSFDELYDSQILAPLPAPFPEPAAREAANTAPLTEASMTSETLAELYAKQGLLDKAARMYERLLIQSPDNARYRERLDALRGGVSPAPQPVKAAEPPPPPPPPPAPKRGSEERNRLLADIAALRPKEEAAPRDRRLDTLKQWLHAVEQERKRA